MGDDNANFHENIDEILEKWQDILSEISQVEVEEIMSKNTDEMGKMESKLNDILDLKISTMKEKRENNDSAISAVKDLITEIFKKIWEDKVEFGKLLNEIGSAVLKVESCVPQVKLEASEI
ncbi:hypothetical protein BVRB_1g022570 [Beta vulgaris subsp. vulgaris]|nr:hypothetical protein BVRB_1g022570 [Beta vulgaris subsp. vulgaris]